jgi:hypothetical protein
MEKSKSLKIYWKDKSGTRHRFWIYPRGTKFNEPCPGIYIYARETSPHKWIPIYIGQTENVNVRLTNPEQHECVDQNGGTHVHVSIITNEKSRRAIEKDLIQQWKPVCNTQFGLITEEVAEANPDLVVRDETGEIYNARYDAVAAMLLNEFLKEHRKIEEQERSIQEQEATITEVKSNAARQKAAIALQQQEIQALTAAVKEQAAQIQKMNARFEMSNPQTLWQAIGNRDKKPAVNTISLTPRFDIGSDRSFRRKQFLHRKSQLTCSGLRRSRYAWAKDKHQSRRRKSHGTVNFDCSWNRDGALRANHSGLLEAARVVSGEAQ